MHANDEHTRPVTAPAPSRSFRQIPPAIYIALAAHIAGATANVIAMQLASGSYIERILATRRWQLLYQGCNIVFAILLALGLAELARRLTGRSRALTRAGAYVGLTGLLWTVAWPLVDILDPSFEQVRRIQEWLSFAVSLGVLVSAVLLTLGSNAWRRAPAAAALLVAIYATGYGIPVIGPAITAALGGDPMTQQLHGLARIVLHAIAVLPIAATLAASGREPPPEPRAARAGLRLARGVLLFRVVAACLISVLLVGGRSPGAAKIVQLGGPAVVAITMLVLAIAILRVAHARVMGLPPVSLSLGAALTLGWGTIQLQQLSTIVRSLRDSHLRDEALAISGWFSIAGPLAAALGLALVGSAIAALARSRGDHPLRDAATSRTTCFLVLTLASVGLSTQLAKASTLSGLLAVGLLASLLGIVALGALVGLFERAAEALTAEPELPPARLV